MSGKGWEHWRDPGWEEWFKRVFGGIFFIIALGAGFLFLMLVIGSLMKACA